MTSRRTLRLVAALAAVATLAGAFVAAPAAAQVPGNPFGIMLQGSRAADVAVAKDLGAAYMRKRIGLDSWKGSCPACKPYSDAGIGIVLTLRTSLSGPSAPPADLDSYRRKVGDVLDSIKPVVLTVENEMEVANFYSGTPKQYHAQLAAACDAAEARGIPCADGGLTSHTTTYMVYQSYVDAGRTAEAKDFARRVAYTDLEYRRMTNPANAARIKGHAQKGLSFLRGYRAAGADYVNFHWYRHDGPAFEEAVRYLQSVTGLRAMTNEIGQHNEDPAVIGQMLPRVKSLGLAYAIWFSIDYVVRYPDGPMAILALQNPDGSLRRHGQEFKRFTSSL